MPEDDLSDLSGLLQQRCSDGMLISSFAGQDQLLKGTPPHDTPDRRNGN